MTCWGLNWSLQRCHTRARLLKAGETMALHRTSWGPLCRSAGELWTACRAKIILYWQRNPKACDTQGFCAPLYSLGAGVPAGATWQRGEACALLGAGTVRLSRECGKEDKVLLCGCLHRVASATTTKSNNYFNCEVWKRLNVSDRNRFSKCLHCC